MKGSLEAIDSARAALELHLQRPQEWHGVIRRQVLASAVHYSTAIEGNVLNREQVESIIAGEAIEAPEKDRIEAQNYYEAMRWAQGRAQDTTWSLGRETVLTLHFLVGKNLGSGYEPLGRYREGQNTVQDRDSGEVIYFPPKVDEVDSSMEELFEWIDRRSGRDQSPFIINAMAHLNFVAIHPFSDGNGRVGRLVCSLLLMREGYKAQAFWSLEQYLGENADEYGRILAQVLGPRWSPGDVVATAWIEWYLDAIATQVQLAAELMALAMAQFTAVAAGFVADGVQLTSRTFNQDVMPVWIALNYGSVTRRQMLRYGDLLPTTITRVLGNLRRRGYLRLIGRGRGARYVAGPQTLNWGPYNDLIDIALTFSADSVDDQVSKVAAEIGRLKDSSSTLF